LHSRAIKAHFPEENDRVLIFSALSRSAPALLVASVAPGAAGLADSHPLSRSRLTRSALVSGNPRASHSAAKAF